MHFLFSLKASVAIIALCIATSLSGETLERPPHIEVQGRQLLVDGKPFVMKGVCYNPVPKGGAYPEGLITQHPTKQDLAVIKKDFEMMHAAGINTIRTYMPLLDKRILKLLADNKLKTIVPIRTACSISTNRVSTTLSALKNEPSTLIWEIGNECNLNHFYSGTAIRPEGMSSSQLALFVTTTASLIKNLDSTHPVSIGIGIPTILQSSYLSFDDTNIDLYGLNYYNGLTHSELCLIWPQLSNKPLYLSEFGATAYNLAINGVPPDSWASDVSFFATQLDRYYLFGQLPPPFLYNNNISLGTIFGGAAFGEDENAQADGITSLVTDVQSHLSANNSDNIFVGGCVFEWSDEWWKAPWKNNTLGLSLHSIDGTCCANAEGFLDYGPYPDHFYHEEWFGLLTIDRVPRASYFALQKLYSE